LLGLYRSKQHWWNDTYRGKGKYLEKDLPQCYFSTTNPTWTGLAFNPGLSMGEEGAAANHLSRGMGSATEL